MILLHEEYENEYKTNGFGALDNEIIDPLIHWTLNGEYSISFSYPFHSFLGDQLKLERQIEVVTEDYSDVFRIKEIEKSMGYVKVYCEHKTYDLYDNFIEDIFIVDKTGVEAIKKISEGLVTPHPFILSSEIYDVSSARMVRLNAMQALIDSSLENSFVSRWGGEIYRHYNEFKIVKKIGINKGVKIQYAKDLIGYTAKINSDNITTRIMPIGFDGLLLPELYIDSPLIDMNRPKIKLIKYEEVKAAVGEYKDDEDAVPREEAYEELRRLANLEFSENEIDKPTASYEVNFMLLKKTKEYKGFEILQDIQGGDLVEVEHIKDGFNVHARVVEYTKNILSGQYKSMKLGDVGTSLIQSTPSRSEFIEINKKNNAMLSLVDILREEVKNSWANEDAYNYKLENDNPYGLPGGYYSFDKPINENPTQVIGISAGKQFIANSKNQDGSWNWTTIATGDGYIADNMFAGFISADLIRGGMQKALDGDTYINWNTGDFNIMSTNRRLRLSNGTLFVYDRPTSPSGTNNQIFSIQTGISDDYTVQLAKLVKAYTAESIAISTRTADNRLEDYIICSGVGENSKVESFRPFHLNRGLTVFGGSTFNSGLTVIGGLKVGEIYSATGQKRIHLQDSGAVVTLDGNTQVLGDFGVTGTKNALVETENFGHRAVSAYETAEYYFGDIGSAKLKNGKCKIEIEEIFKETVNTNIDYQVFLQAYGNANIWVSERHQDYFIVEGTDDIEFGWELKAKRKGYENTRLEKQDLMVKKENDYAEPV